MAYSLPNTLKIILVTSILGLAGCKDDNDKLNDAAEQLWGALEQEHAAFSKALNGGNGEDAAAAVVNVEQMMIDFDEEHFDKTYCTRNVRLVCFSHLVNSNTDPLIVKFLDAYEGVERMGSLAQMQFPDDLEVLRGPQSEAGNSLLPPPSSD